jgi:exo-1,4-beta-D-glucosaminidase
MTLRPKLALAILCGIALAAPSLAQTAGADAKAAENSSLNLEAGWMLESSCKVTANGEQISTPGFGTQGWHVTKVPSTVLAALVADKMYPDPYFGMNLRSIPGTTYPIGKNFSEMPMPKDSPFHCAWWYRTEFRTLEAFKGRRVSLNFDGINNRANIWVDGVEIASKNDIAGAYRAYTFDVTRLLSNRGVNALAVEVFAQGERDLGIDWNDWNPTPPDKNMGLWRRVYLRAMGAVEIRYPQVITHFPGDWASEADLTVEAEVRNRAAQRITATIDLKLEGQALQQNVTLAPGEAGRVRFTPSQYRNLRIREPELWWPHQMGAPKLHQLTIQVSVGGVVSDSASARYGIREVTSELDAEGHRLFRINGKKILIRGGGWAPDMLLREDPARLQTEFRYVRDLNLNAIRLEGPMVTDAFYDLADEQGVLVLAGWTCCDYWMDWKKWAPSDLAIARRSLRSEILRMRNHPSVIVWMNGSDEAPPTAIERAYVNELEALDWANPYLVSASEKQAPLGEPSGMKMLGPYDYTPPDYWLRDTRFGGAFGFASEISPGPAIPPESSLGKFLSPLDNSPGTAAWNYHAGGERFTNLHHFDEAMRAIYGPPTRFGDYQRKAQAMAYDTERAMFEAYSRNKYGSTGVIQWMLNNAWPSLIWHLYDYYSQPAGGYFGAKKACEPIHVQYSYDDRSVVLVNSTYEDLAGLTVTVKLYDAGLQERFSAQVKSAIGADGVAKVLRIPETAFLATSPIYFAQLTLKNERGETISSNFYWLSAKRNVYDWANTDAFTAISLYEDLTALETLPSAGRLALSTTVDQSGEGPLVRVKIRNPSVHLAFQIHVGIRPKGENSEIVPVLWQDNYIQLMPGESREITAQFLSPDALDHDSELAVDGWNIEPLSLPIAGITSRATGRLVH